jgi:hypothetical protein
MHSRLRTQKARRSGRASLLWYDETMQRGGVLVVALFAGLLGSECEDLFENDPDYPEGSICAAAESVDDACEKEFGDDAPECKPFDDVDESCEAGSTNDDDRCALASPLDDECEALFGEEAAQCAPLDDIDEQCEAEGAPDPADTAGDPEDA